MKVLVWLLPEGQWYANPGSIGTLEYITLMVSSLHLYLLNSFEAHL